MKSRWLYAIAGLTAAGLGTAYAVGTPTKTSKSAPPPSVKAPEIVHRFYGSMPTGVTVSRSGRIFVNYPRWGDPVPFTVGEIVGDKEVPFPDATINRYDRAHPADCLVSVQSVVVDPQDRLWVLDTGAPKLGPAVPGGPKLVCINLATNKVVKTVRFKAPVVDASTYLNDVRFDLRPGTGGSPEGVAYITDSGAKGRDGILVVNLATGETTRRLGNFYATRPVSHFVPIVEGEKLLQRKPGQKPQPVGLGSDGIALSADGKTLFFCPLSSRHLYSVSTAALLDPNQSDAMIAKTVRDLGDKGSGSDGLEADSKGRVYCTLYEKNGVSVREPNGKFTSLVQDARLIWPDTLSVAANGYLYGTANQLDRQATYHYGKDLRKKPYLLWRVPIDGGPVALGGGSSNIPTTE